MKRVFLFVLDSVGAGQMPDASDFGDSGANTLRSVFETGRLSIPVLQSLGIGNIDGLSFLGVTDIPKAAVGKAAERSCGKDTTTGHWEIAGLVSPRPMPTFPNGFPKELIDRFSRACGHPVLCNRPYSGTKVIADYGEEQKKKGALIVYTSADSVFQIAAHTDVVPLQELYRCCTIAREMLRGEYAVGRVIARPFSGESPFVRTPDRRDFSLSPPSVTLLDRLKENGLEVLAVGKISDIFAGRGITESFFAHGNHECLEATETLSHRNFNGLCFVNLVDFDMQYGHRNDADGYADALSSFDRFLEHFLQNLHKDDLLILTADHGCDPGDTSTDHTREYVPVLFYGSQISPVKLGVLPTFADIAATIADFLGVSYDGDGESLKGKMLLERKEKEF